MTTTPVIEIDRDECDHCGPHVKAYVHAQLRNGTVSYCGHCGTRYWEALTAQAVTIIDLRHLLHLLHGEAG